MKSITETVSDISVVVEVVVVVVGADSPMVVDMAEN